MIYYPISSVTTMASSSPHSFLKPRRLHHQNPNPNTNRKLTSSSLSPSASSSSSCNHSPSATLDLIILVLVLFSCTFLIASSFSHIIRAVSSLIPLIPISDPLPFLAGFLVFLAAFIGAVEIACYRAFIWSRRCENPRCRGLRKAMEFDVQIQTEDCIRFISSGTGSGSATAVAWKEIDELPWKGGQQGNNPDYECLRAELRRMAPPNGRAVLLFRARCGCPLAKLEAWSQKRGRRHKK
ncbi:uncharacterized protein At5g19025 [Dendrobium catenatum]|uniref:Ribosomal protein L34e superfamily protein n=1 Tax=Dendrobium catenatum TaxID=906689 RepID=A0A2I0W2F3_9ASPA|nr:uncharacterized protein At5g19025 [Dendrobium catenatum]PKU69808.1 Uncharacterized protein MA16_Dca026627 [Dendrobium catenatum]